jgi:hypothetical protein
LWFDNLQADEREAKGNTVRYGAELLSITEELGLRFRVLARIDILENVCNERLSERRKWLRREVCLESP